MKIHKQYPIRDYADVNIDGEVIKVKFKFPTVEQAKRIASTDGTGIAIAICQYCIEDIDGLVDDAGPVKVKLVQGRYGTELPEDILMGLYHAQAVMSLALFYRENVAPSDIDKKK